MTGYATAALAALHPHIETYTTNKRLYEAHRNTTREEA